MTDTQAPNHAPVKRRRVTHTPKREGVAPELIGAAGSTSIFDSLRKPHVLVPVLLFAFVSYKFGQMAAFEAVTGQSVGFLHAIFLDFQVSGIARLEAESVEDLIERARAAGLLR